MKVTLTDSQGQHIQGWKYWVMIGALSFAANGIGDFVPQATPKAVYDTYISQDDCTVE